MIAPRPRSLRLLVVALLAGPLVLCTACTGSENPVDERSQLLARPSLEQAVDRYEQMQRRIRTEVDAVIGTRAWADESSYDVNGCGTNFTTVPDAKTWTLPRYGFAGGITAEQWPRVADAVNRVLREYGFSTDGLVDIDRNGYRQISGIERATGATLEFRSELNTNVRIRTGCHLPAAGRTG